LHNRIGRAIVFIHHGVANYRFSSVGPEAGEGNMTNASGPIKRPSNTQPEGPTNAELTLAFYAAARAETVQRLALREQTFLAWIGTASVVLGLALGNPTNMPPAITLLLLEVIPILSLFFGVVIHRHHRIIEHIANSYINGELARFLRQPEKQAPRHWDNSGTVKNVMRRFVRQEVLIHLAFLTVLPCVCLVYTFKRLGHICALDSFSSWLFWIGLVCTVTVVGVGVNLYLSLPTKEASSVS
jgi:hypothetical protein